MVERPCPLQVEENNQLRILSIIEDWDTVEIVEFYKEDTGQEFLMYLYRLLSNHNRHIDNMIKYYPEYIL